MGSSSSMSSMPTWSRRNGPKVGALCLGRASRIDEAARRSKLQKAAPPGLRRNAAQFAHVGAQRLEFSTTSAPSATARMSAI